ncbi:Uncharacterized protein conserved in bacteria [Streptomyces sp. MnatMP-M77]|uniref:DUF2637 domain-containing protein n=1 Tax=unclassified Streptomyces TaxID=2593676 RepID=UPI000804AE63|nr:DUF2637 domain-containing protein [Streptomyces sp. MnatMP-M77]MYT77528.1 DUF2637 domain-containing protein [Streptomyces sp. SID8364]SBU99345.1 Uncharacterized protein conserved in bacteria [Streptomyces sp. MnatMP-M77]
MTITEWPRTAAEPDPVSPAPAAVSATPGTVSETPDVVSETQKRNPDETTPAVPRGPLTGMQKLAIGGIIVFALVLAGIGLYLSFAHVASFAHKELRFGSLEKGQLFAVGVDVGIMVMIAVDLLMAWLKRPITWIRYPVWLLTSATVVLNAASAAPKDRPWELVDYVAAFAHGVVPVLFIMIVEVGRDAIDRIVRPGREGRDAIPLIRWVLAPFATPRIYRRMRLWGVGSYPEMVRREQDLLAYEQWLKRKYVGDLSKATDDERLPMKMAPYGYTVGEALAMPDQQEAAAEQREEEAERRRLEATTRKELAEKRAEAERLEADGQLETVRARVDSEKGMARAQSKAQISAAEKAAARDEAALETAVQAEARTRRAEAERQEAEAREATADADLRTAELERAAAQKRKEAAEADRVAAAEAQAVETQAIAEARRAAAEADRVAAETAKAAAETRRATAETARLEAEEIERQEIAAAGIEAARKAAAETAKAAAETHRAAAEIERAAVEAEDIARLKPRERGLRKVARMILAVGGDAERLPLADIQREVLLNSAGTASEYRQEAAELLASGYRP